MRSTGWPSALTPAASEDTFSLALAHSARSLARRRLGDHAFLVCTRGDGPLAGLSLEAALTINPAHHAWPPCSAKPALSVCTPTGFANWRRASAAATASRSGGGKICHRPPLLWGTHHHAKGPVCRTAPMILPEGTHVLCTGPHRRYRRGRSRVSSTFRPPSAFSTGAIPRTDGRCWPTEKLTAVLAVAVPAGLDRQWVLEFLLDRGSIQDGRAAGLLAEAADTCGCAGHAGLVRLLKQAGPPQRRPRPARPCSLMAKRNCTIEAAVAALARLSVSRCQDAILLCACGSWFRTEDGFQRTPARCRSERN